jgi:hypothetical protein
MIDAKYNTKDPKILYCHDASPSTFWEGVIWAAQAVRGDVGCSGSLRRRGVPKPLEYDLFKEIESVKHLFFDC